VAGVACEDSPQLRRDAGQAIFGADAAGYHAGRIGYPDDLYEIVLAGTPSHPAVLEIGSGTGLVTEALLARGVGDLVAVEASADLVAFTRERLPDRRLSLLTAAFPDVEMTQRFDVIVCAAAFHWMEPHAALAKVASLLKPGGRWAVWWNSYRNHGVGDALADQITPLLDGIALPPSDGLLRHYSLDAPFHTRLIENAGFTDVTQHVFRRERTLDAAEVRALYASYSYVRLLAPTERDRLLDRITALVVDSFSGRAPNVVLTALYTGQLASEPRP
jgi:SAM-dependent methyltransferase